MRTIRTPLGALTASAAPLGAGTAAAAAARASTRAAAPSGARLNSPASSPSSHRRAFASNGALAGSIGTPPARRPSAERSPLTKPAT
ncbi:Uncharacterised protein [Burkholderia pseudomallei]|nr:Uncharacterised protein [Burkholderia pseudomallei]